jgi:hypothetical protein
MPVTELRRSAREQRQQPVHVVDIESGIEFRAETIDTSSGGLSVRASLEPALGAEMEVTFGAKAQRRSLFKVLRINPSESGFRIAGELKQRWTDASEP